MLRDRCIFDQIMADFWRLLGELGGTGDFGGGDQRFSGLGPEIIRPGPEILQYLSNRAE